MVKAMKRKLDRSRSSSMDGAKIVKKKRVSFSSSHETRVIGPVSVDKIKSIYDENKDVKPRKSILKKTMKQHSKKNITTNFGLDEEVEMKKSGSPALSHKPKPKQIKLPNERKNNSAVVRKKIKVQRSTKEILLNMSKKERKEFIRQLAAKNKPNYELATQAKLLWEKIRSSKISAENKEKCIDKLLGLCRSKMKNLIYSHGTSRVIQCLFALKRPTIRQLIFEELRPEIATMAKSKYAKFVVSKMLKYGSKEQRDEVISALKGHYVRLYKTIYSAGLVDSIYGEWAKADQYHAIISEFYGPEYVIFQSELIGANRPDINKIVIEKPEKIPLIMTNLESILEGVARKIPILRLSITHKLLLDFLSHCSADQRQSMIDNLKDHLPEICHTRDGSRAALICVWNASAKDRKAIVKSFKGLVIRSCQDECVRRVLFGIFDAVDDTVLVNKIITREIANNIADLIYHKYGVGVLHYLVHPRDYRVIGKGLYEMLKMGDNNPHSKKAAQARYSELFECVKPALCDFMTANMREMITNKTSAVLILDTLELPVLSDPFIRDIPVGVVHACFQAIAEIASDEFVPFAAEGPPHIVQRGCARFVFRKLLQSDPKREEGNKLSDFLADIPAELLSSWTGMDCGCYTLVEMLESGSAKARKALQSALNRSSLENSGLKGAKLLLEKLADQQQMGKMMQKHKKRKETGGENQKMEI